MYKKLLLIIALTFVTASVVAVEPESEPSAGAHKSKRVERFDRGLDAPAYAFVKKGVWMTGVKASWAQYSMDDYEFLVVDDINLGGYTLSSSANLGYVFRDNMMFGMRFGYDRTSIDIKGASIGVSDIDLDFSNVSLLRHTYTGTLFYRYYMGLAQGQRFAFFTEIQLGLGGSQAKQYMSANDGVYETSFNLSLGLTPGIIAFVTNNFALEASVDLIGFKYKDVRQTANQIESGGRTSSSLNCKISLLSIGLGMTIYF